jgi:hypothetical protein
MAATNQLWSAARINAELAKNDGVPLAFTPYGEIVRVEEYVKQIEALSAKGGATKSYPTRVADVVFLKVGPIETVQTNITLLPALIACLAIDPEPWSIVVIHPNALDAVGPVRDVSSPLRDWLLRAIRLGRAVSICLPSHPLIWKRAEFKGFEIFESLQLKTAKPPTLASFPLPDLVPVDQKIPVWLMGHLEAFDAGHLGSEVKSREDAISLVAGLWQMNGCLERSHELAQSVEGRCRKGAGDYWHAIMHRREPDYSNAKYWFRRVGSHGIHPFLARDADEILTACPSTEARRWQVNLTGNNPDKWNSGAFVDLCEHVERGGDEELLLAARQIQLIEMVLLLKSTYHDTFH